MLTIGLELTPSLGPDALDFYILYLSRITGPNEGDLTMKKLETFEQAFDKVVADLRKLMISKQRDYGHENITSFGELGVLVRANDKMARLRNLLWGSKEPKNEGVEDTWRDLANYAIIALMLREKIFTLPLKEERCQEE